jgi:hypothetical protein
MKAKRTTLELIAQSADEAIQNGLDELNKGVMILGVGFSMRQPRFIRLGSQRASFDGRGQPSVQQRMMLARHTDPQSILAAESLEELETDDN